ncbi:MAG: 16S rRNA (guanine(966)-N(2))-methyltransferase RsmD [Dehalococcoidia bacterium]|nr:16S rRNA (guanine(966)-N(2))-methyltransferase RsmD [Dehalococcoidia bacterium]
MRVIAGSARGRPLSAPPGTATRPTSDRVRGAMFDILAAAGADFSRVLDLYAGSGALGIEALSRNDGACDFVEGDARACGAIRRNLASLGMEERAHVYQMAVARALRELPGPYTLVLMDPPYADEEAVSLLDAWAGPERLDVGAIIVLEHSRRTAAPERLGMLPLFRERRHGDTMIAIYAAAEA